jgi:hypothetical protein
LLEVFKILASGEEIQHFLLILHSNVVIFEKAMHPKTWFKTEPVSQALVITPVILLLGRLRSGGLKMEASLGKNSS